MIKEFWKGFSDSFASVFEWVVGVLNMPQWNWEVVGVLTAFCLIVVGGLAIFVVILDKLFVYMEDSY